MNITALFRRSAGGIVLLNTMLVVMALLAGLVLPSGGVLAFVSQREEGLGIYLMDIERAIFQWTVDVANRGATLTWSPNGNVITFDIPLLVRENVTDQYFPLYFMSAAGRDVHALTDGVGFDTDPAWSPDGTQIAFVSGRDGNSEIYIMDTDGSNMVRLTSHRADDANPDWSPDGSQIAFTSNRGPNYEIHVMDVDGSNIRQLTDTAGVGHETNPDWSPDGSQIAFESNRDPHPQIYLMNPDGSNVHRLFESESWEQNPAWSPDGSRIAFVSGRDQDWEIYVVDADGRNPRRLTHHPGDDLFPAWRP